jgi:hypothetical protein
MDFGTIFQLRDKKFWWINVVFYFTMSLLLATVLCYLIFIVKNNIQRHEIKEWEEKLLTVGTESQKDQEKEVIAYQRKIADFVRLFRSHEFASNVFVFMEKQTFPNVWFKQFNLSAAEAQIQVSGEADDMQTFGRQVAGFENNEYVESVNVLNSSLNSTAKIDFNLSLSLEDKIFDYIAEEKEISIIETTSPTDGQPLVDQTIQQNSGKLITLFNFSSPEAIGVIDQTNHTIKLDVPFGADLTNLTPTINISTGATIFPLSESPQDFTNPISYIVTAQDSTTQKYIVNVNVLPKPKSSTGTIVIWIVFIIIILSIVGAGIFWFMKKNKQNVNL